VSASLAPAQHPLAIALRAALTAHRDAVLQAPTGAGKSTLVPLALLTELATAQRRILMLEPRRLAARAVAARMAALLREPLGATVGYRMRLDTCVSSTTRIEVITEGILTRLLQEDPGLEGVGWLILDEYHERSLAADLGLALALDARRELGADFRILVMSATLEVERVAALLEGAAIVSVPARTFPVEINYLGRGLPALPGPAGVRYASADYRAAPELAVVRAVQRALAEAGGNVLVFLPGVGEIQRVEALLRAAELPQAVEVLALHGQLSPQAQDAVLSAAPTARRVVLATNIAETSLTVPGVTAVVDTGLVRRARFDPSTGMSRLELTRISRASSEQRAGRAGRLAPGRCYRLWGRAAQEQLAAATPAEILEADLAPLALELARWGCHDAARLSWLDPPPAAPLAQARELLVRLDALDESGRLTAAGRQIARLPVHPRLGHMMLLAHAAGSSALAAQLAALLSERDLLRGPERDPDIRTRLELLQGPRGAGAVERTQRAARAFAATLQSVQPPPGSTSEPDIAAAAPALQAVITGARTTDQRQPDLVGSLLALAFPDRIGQRREGAPGRYLLSNGRGAAFNGQPSLARAPLIVAVALDDREREARIDLAAPLESAAFEQLFADRVRCEQCCVWDEDAGSVQLLETRRFGALVLEERRLPLADEQHALPLVLELLQRRGLGALPWDAHSRTLQRRMELVRALGRSDLADWPASDDAALSATLSQWLTPYLTGITRRGALARLPLRQALYARLSPAQQRTLETLAPREWLLPNGSRTRIDYLDEQAPCVAVRLQDVFGLAATPVVAGGAVPLTLKLLSPAQRPVQITRDLAGFWRAGYAEVRKQLRGRYPKHAWPENPLEVPADASKNSTSRPRAIRPGRGRTPA
jgi:ATP-dependent helicase HrpB